VNRLAANSNEASIPPQSKPSTSKAFDFHGDSYIRPDHNPNKKQRVRGEWEGDDISSKEIIDLDSQAPRSKSNKESSVARPGYSAYTRLGTEKPVQEYDYVEALMSRRKHSRNRKLSKNEQESTVPSESQTEKAHGSSRFSNPESSKATVVRLDESQTLNGEDPNDPISDAEKKAVKKADRNPSKSYPEVILRGYRSTSLRRSTGHSKFKPNAARANAERERRKHLAETPVIDSEDSVDDLSAEHYKASPGSPDKHNRSANLSAATKMNADRAQTIPDSSDEEITKLEKGNIKPTAFSASKKVNPKETKLGQAKYEVLQVFSAAHPWFLGGSRKEWSLFHDRDKGLLSIEGEDTPPLKMAVNPISSIEYSEDNSKMIIHKSRDNSFGGAVNICITLGSPIESEVLTRQIALSPTIKSILKSRLVFCIALLRVDISTNVISNREYLEKVFATTRKSAEATLQRPTVREEPDDVRLARAKTRARLDMAQEEKRSARGPRIIDQMASIDEDSQKQTRGTAGLKKARTSLDGNRTTDTSEPSNRKLTAAEFYNKSFSPPLEGNYHETRSSARLADKSPPSRPRKDSVELPWTATHPDWKNSWKSSIMYPPKGKIKVTVNEEDIERLDDGNYLNDTLIEFYIRWLEHHLLQDKPDIAKRIYFLNTFFYERLTTNSKGKRGFNYEAVQRWTSKIDLLSYDYIVVPVNENAHWYVAIICNAPRLLASNPEVLEMSESQGEGAVIDDVKEIGDKLTTKKSDVKSPDHVHTSATSTSIGDKLDRQVTPEPTVVTSDVVQAPAPRSTPTRKGKRKSHVPPPRKYNPGGLRIITLDSLGLKHSPTCTNLKEYLVAEIKSKHGVDIPPPGSIGMTATNIPQQDNFWDCGLFLLSYIEKFLERPDEFIHGLLQNNLDYVTEWPEAVDMRNKIRDILFSLQEGGVNESKSLQPSKGDKAEPSITTTSASKCDSSADTTEDSDESNPEVVGTGQLYTPLLNRDNKKRYTTEDKHDLDSKPAEESIIPQEPTKEDGNKSVRDRRPTPYPTSPKPNDLDEDDTHGSQGAPVQEAGESDDEMLLSNEHPTKSSAQTPSPKLLSDPSFLSSSVSSAITPKQYEKMIPSSPSSPRTHKSPTAATSGKDTKPRAYPVDAADQAIIGKQGKKNTHTYFLD
jgi:sentrin-specific protease 7